MDKPIQKVFTRYVSGIPSLQEDTEVIVATYEDCIALNYKHIIPFSEIKSAKLIKDTEITEKDKSVILRAVAGGILLGPLGAIIGGMSGLQKGKKKQEILLLSIEVNKNEENYTGLFLLESRSKLLYYGDKNTLENMVKFINSKIK